MTHRQLLWPEAGVWVGQDETGVRYRMPGRSGVLPGMPVLPLIGPASAGGPVLWLDARATLAGSGTQAQPLQGVIACASDPNLLAATVRDGTLLLIGPERGTSVALPALPQGLAAIGDAFVAHCLLAFPGEVHALRWQGDVIAADLLSRGTVDGLTLLAGEPPVAMLRMPSQGVDRLEVFVYHAAPWARWWPLPPLLVEHGLPLSARQEPSGLTLQVQSGRWLRHHLGAWREVSGVAASGVPTYRHGRWAAIGPEPWFEKEWIPSPAKLAVARHRQPDQEHIAQGSCYGTEANFVSRRDGR